jgi:hypothetical protein
MGIPNLNELVEQAAQLPPGEQLRLAAMLIERALEKYPAAPTRRKWREIRGTAPYPMMGEDAQAWVTRTRREGDHHREQQWEQT